MRNLLILCALLSLVLVIPVHAQDDGSEYSCVEGAENDIVALAQSAFEAGEWQTAYDLAVEGRLLCASDVFRLRDMTLLAYDAQVQVEFYETQAFMDAAYPGVTDFGDYSIFMNCVGQGPTTIIFEHALFAASAQSWESITPAFEDIALVCTYDRAGAGISSFLPARSSRTAQDMVDDLIVILQTHGVPGPYILVGQHFGGINALLFADQYPQAVGGLVLIDILHPDYFDLADGIDPGIPSEGAVVTPERIDIWASLAQAQEISPDFGDMPIYVITAGDSVDEEVMQPSEIAPIWLQLQEELLTRSTNTEQVVVEYASTLTLNTKYPEEIIKGIDWVIEQVTGNPVERE